MSNKVLNWEKEIKKEKKWNFEVDRFKLSLWGISIVYLLHDNKSLWENVKFCTGVNPVKEKKIDHNNQ